MELDGDPSWYLKIVRPDAPRIVFLLWKWLTPQDALDESMRYDYGGPEPLNALANLRLSQNKPEEAAKSAEEAFRRLGLCGGSSIKLERF